LDDFLLRKTNHFHFFLPDKIVLHHRFSENCKTLPHGSHTPPTHTHRKRESLSTFHIPPPAMKFPHRTTTIILLSFWRPNRVRAFGTVSTTRWHTNQRQHLRVTFATRSSTAIGSKPKRGTVVDGYQTVSVNCAKCGFRLFRYKKKNGTKSNLIKCYVERIPEDCGGLLTEEDDVGRGDDNNNNNNNNDTAYACPSCDTTFARPALIRGLPALKLVGGKTRMTKK